MSFSRRKFLVLAGASAAGATMLSPLEAFYARVASGQDVEGVGFGPLRPRLPVNARELTNTVAGDLSRTPLLELPPNFNYTAFSITGQTMSDGSLVPGDHDGMAAFPGPRNSTILVRNHELSPDEEEFGNTLGSQTPNPYDPFINVPAGAGGGGTTTLVIGPNRKLIKDFASLSGTVRNCAGGPTPWGSWISCEETTDTPATDDKVTRRHGYNFEVPASVDALSDAVPLIAMGRFNHEAVAVDPRTGYVYETEDQGDSSFYRFRPNQYGNLQSGGVLEALVIKGKPTALTWNNPQLAEALGLTLTPIAVGEPMPVEWVEIEDVDPVGDTLRREAQAKGAAIFFRGEGAWYGNGLIYFVATQGGPAALDELAEGEEFPRGNGQVWAYDPAKQTITLVVEAPANGELLDEPDNITVAPFGDLFLCEDGGGEQFVVGVNSKGELYQFARNALDTSEFAGATFSPDGRTLFVNSQGVGITYAIWGPWPRQGRDQEERSRRRRRRETGEG